MPWPPWEAPTVCTSGPSQGALALMKWFLEEYGDEGGFNLGIYNCRTVRGARTLSCHGEGRACDFGFPVGDPDGDELLRRLRRAPGRLGLQAIIYERRIYSAKSPQGREYTGAVPHWDHLHVELTRESAKKLTLATVRRVMATTLRKPGSRSLREGMKGDDVRWLQQRLRIGADGVFGPKTKQAVLLWERKNKSKYPKLVVDGTVGPLTWKTLGVNPRY